MTFNRHKTEKGGRGFTLVELVVVLVIIGILASIAIPSIVGYWRSGQFRQNEANAKTLYQAAQVSLTRMETNGTLEDYLARAQAAGTDSGLFPGTDKAGRVYALQLTKGAYGTKDNTAAGLVTELLSPYIYDTSLMNAAVCVEVDTKSGEVYSVFYCANKAEGETINTAERDYETRRKNLVGYYSAQDLVNVVDLPELEEETPQLKNLMLYNEETLNLQWDTEGQAADLAGAPYTITFYKNTDGHQTEAAAAPAPREADKLFEVTVDYAAADHTAGTALLPVTVYKTDAAGKVTEDTARSGNYTFPLAFTANADGTGHAQLTLDAMSAADILVRIGTDWNSALAKTSFYSILRFVAAPADLYAVAEGVDHYSETENTLFAAWGSESKTVDYQTRTVWQGSLNRYRHLYNTRWLSDEKVAAQKDAYKNGVYKYVEYTDTAAVLDWQGAATTPQTTVAATGKKLGSAAVVYQLPTAGSAGSVLRPAYPKEETVAFPAVPLLGERQSLNGQAAAGGENAVLKNVQLRSDSAPRDALADAAGLAKTRYLGIYGINRGTIRNLTVTDADAVVNLTAPGAADAAVDAAVKQAQDTGTRPALAAAAELKELRGVGALCGLSTGVLQNVELAQSGEDALCRVAAAVAVTTAKTFADPDDALKTGAENGDTVGAIRGIGGVAGIFRQPVGTEPNTNNTYFYPALAQTLKAAGAVTGLLLDATPETTAFADAQAEDQGRFLQADAAAATTTYLPVGIGGVLGYAAGSAVTAEGWNGVNAAAQLENAAQVTGNMFTGGVAGCLSFKDTVWGAELGYKNTGAVRAAVNYAAAASRYAGQFFGGLAGYARNVTFAGCASEGAVYTVAQLTADPTLLKGDFVGGLAGYAAASPLGQNVSTAATGVIAGRQFVGGYFGAGSGSMNTDWSGTPRVNAASVVGNRCVGGFVGAAGAGSSLLALENTGLVAGAGTDPAYIGGITGRLDRNWSATGAAGTAAITNCRNNTPDYTAALTALGMENADYVGGLAGYSDGSITLGSTPTNSILVGRDYVGGVAGYACNAEWQQAIANSNGAAITAQITAAGDYAGGVAGYLAGGLDLGGKAVNAVITGRSLLGGVAGCTAADAPVSNGGAVKAEITGDAAEGDYIGGAVGSLGGSIALGTATEAKLTGHSYVGGAIGYAGPAAGIGSGGTLSGTVAATGDCVGGYIGLNRSDAPAAATLRVDSIAGRYMVAGAIGANLPEKTGTGGYAGIDFTYYKNKKTTVVTAEGVCGSLFGYMRIVGAGDYTELTPADLLPAIDADTGALVDSPKLNNTDAQLSLYNYTDNGQIALRINANAYAGGVVGATAEGTCLTLQNYLYTGTIRAGAPGATVLTKQGVRLADLFAARGYGETYYTLAAAHTTEYGAVHGGIIGLAGSGTVLSGCTLDHSYNGLKNNDNNNVLLALNAAAPNVIGNMAGINAGLIENCTINDKIGTSQYNPYPGNELSGLVAGINVSRPGAVNSGVINTCTLSRGATGAFGLYYVGGVVGANLANAQINWNTAFYTGQTKSTYDYLGGFAGYNAGSITLESITVTNDNSGNGKLFGRSWIGGIAGYNAAGGGIIATGSPAVVNMNILDTSATSCIGGVAGQNDGSIENCQTTVAVPAKGSYAGGIAGINTGSLVNCTSRSAVTASGADSWAGGITAQNGREGGGSTVGLVKDCRVEAGTITSKNGVAGAVAGRNYGTVENSIATTVNVQLASQNTTYNYLGGIVGRNEAGAVVRSATLTAMPTLATSAKTLTSAGAVAVNYGTVENIIGTQYVTAGTKNVIAGGIVGENKAGGRITGCRYSAVMRETNTDAVMQNRRVGGIAGINEAEATIENCALTGAEIYVSGYEDGKNHSATGGIAGENAGTIRGSTAAGSITAYNGDVGGLVGLNTATGLVEESGAANMAALKNVELIPAQGTAPAKTLGDLLAAGRTVAPLYSAFKTQTAGALDEALTAYNAAAEANERLLDGLEAAAAADAFAPYIGGSELTVTLTPQTSTNTNVVKGAVGGLVGRNSGSVKNCATGSWQVTANRLMDARYSSGGTWVTGRYSAVGGAIGVNDCAVADTVMDETNTCGVLGVVNCAAVKATFANPGSYNDGGNGTRSLQQAVGGVVGRQLGTTALTAEAVYATVQTDDKGNRTVVQGDTVTEPATLLANCVNLGAVSNENTNVAGGLVGCWHTAGGAARYSANLGAVTVRAYDVAGNSLGNTAAAGGVLGHAVLQKTNERLLLANCRNAAAVTVEPSGTTQNGTGHAGGIAALATANTGSTKTMALTLQNCENNAAAALTAYGKAGYAAGGLAWLDGSSAENVQLNFTRVRNYATELLAPGTTATPAGASLAAGIYGGRSVTYTKQAAENGATLRECFTLYDEEADAAETPLTAGAAAYELLDCADNYFMDNASFAVQNLTDDNKVGRRVGGIANVQAVYRGENYEADDLCRTSLLLVLQSGFENADSMANWFDGKANTAGNFYRSVLNTSDALSIVIDLAPGTIASAVTVQAVSGTAVQSIMATLPDGTHRTVAVSGKGLITGGAQEVSSIELTLSGTNGFTKKYFSVKEIEVTNNGAAIPLWDNTEPDLGFTGTPTDYHAAPAALDGTRLYAGIDRDAAPATDVPAMPYYGAAVRDAIDVTKLTNTTAKIVSNNFGDATKLRRMATARGTQLANLPVLFDDVDGEPGITLHDVVDANVRGWYGILDAPANRNDTSLTAAGLSLEDSLMASALGEEFATPESAAPETAAEPEPTEAPAPTPEPTESPAPTQEPTLAETPAPTEAPEPEPTAEPAPTAEPEPTAPPAETPAPPAETPAPTPEPTEEPAPTEEPEPTVAPAPTEAPAAVPEPAETQQPAPAEEPAEPTAQPEPAGPAG